MKLTEERIYPEMPEGVRAALFTVGHWLANMGPDMKTNISVTEGKEVITYDIEMKEVGRYEWLIDGSVAE